MVTPTHYPAIKNAPLVGLAEGNGQFSNFQLAFVVLAVPYLLQLFVFFNVGGWTAYFILVLVTGLPTTIGYWHFMSTGGSRVNEKVKLPGKNIEEYLTIHDPELKAKYHGKKKIPMQLMHDAFFDGKIDFNGSYFLQKHFRVLFNV
jgi:sphingolipid C9-methyltransferase